MIKIALTSENGEISSGDLKRKAEECSRNGKTISSALFSFHLKQMLKLDRKRSRYIIPILEKRDCGRGSNIFYSLTNSAKKRLKLELPLLIEESDREKAYHLFFNFTAFQNVPTDNNSSVKLSEEEFEHFLSKIHISRNELKQISVKNRLFVDKFACPRTG